MESLLAGSVLAVVGFCALGVGLAALRTARAERARSVEAAPEATVELDRSGRIVRANAAAESLAEADAGKLVGRHLSDLVEGGSSLGDGRDGAFRGSLRAFDGRTRGVTVRWQRGPEGFVAGIRPVEPREEAIASRELEALRQSEKLLRSIIDHTPAIIFAKELDGRYLLVNNHFEKVAGVPRREIYGRTDHDLFPPDMARRLREHDARTLEAGSPFLYEERFAHPDGERTFLTVKVPLLDVEGNATALCGVATDITARKHDEEERVELASRAQHAQKLESLGALAGGIAHDFNNLLLTILGNASLAREDAEPGSRLARQLTDVEEAATRASQLCKQLLAYSGKGRFVMQALDPNQRLREVVHLLDVAVTRGATIHLDLEPDLPAVLGDPAQFDQALMNLVTNGSEAIGDRRGVISIETGRVDLEAGGLDAMLHAERSEPGPYVRVAVSDTGCGMEASELQRVFDPFYTTKSTGRGLGMAAVLGIVRGHGGAIRGRSEPDRGATFELFFPAAEGIEAAPTPRPELTGEWRGHGTVLVVDDEASIRALVRGILEPLGFRVRTASDGDEALRLFVQHEQEVTLVLLDLTMPVLSGEETFRALQRIRGDVPVILTSGYSRTDMADRFTGTGLAGFLQKPYRPGELVAAIRHALEHALE